MRWNDADQWIYSDQVVHPPIIDDETFTPGPGTCSPRAGTRHGRAQAAPLPAPYVLRGVLFCGICDRKMQGHWTNEAAYYRCRFPTEYALANKVDHPRNVYLREDAASSRTLDAWLASKFAPHRLTDTIDELTAAQPTTTGSRRRPPPTHARQDRRLRRAS